MFASLLRCRAAAGRGAVGVVRLAQRSVSKQNGWGMPPIPMDDALPNGTMIGKVVSDKMQKTVNVAIVRLHAPHPKYHKRFKYTRKFMAHDESEQCGIGDTVRITPCRPLSKRKHFMVQAIMRRAPIDIRVFGVIKEAKLDIELRNPAQKPTGEAHKSKTKTKSKDKSKQILAVTPMAPKKGPRGIETDSKPQTLIRRR